MKITNIEIIQNRKPVPLPQPWRPAWNEPSVSDQPSYGFGFYKVETDEGLVGIGPTFATTTPALAKQLLIGQDPAYIGRYFDMLMRGRESAVGSVSAGGLEIALWDLVGKSAGMPVFKLLGAVRDRVPAYAATSQLHSARQSVALAKDALDKGFQAIKLRMHREDPLEDVEVVGAVCDAVGDEMEILVDCNQNNASLRYPYWDRRTAMQIGHILDEMGVSWMEEPLPRHDLAGLAAMCDALDLDIVGGEHCPTIYEFRDALAAGAYDLVQPDVVLGHLGISGLMKVAVMADAAGRGIAPHICGGGNNGLYMAATLQALGAIGSAPYVEFTWDPPALTPDTLQVILKDKITVDEEGMVKVPDQPGIGVELDWDAIESYR